MSPTGLSRLLVPLLLTACVGCGERPEGVHDQHFTEVDVPAPGTGRSVVRERIVFEGSDDQTYVAAAGEPFSHMARRWHAYPFTLYREAPISAKLTTPDPEMQGLATVLIYGPLRDGEWGGPRAAVADANGRAVLPVSDLGPGRYVVMVGPNTRKGFATRYPADMAVGYFDGTEAGPLHFKRIGTTWFATRGTDEFRIRAPLPGNDPTRDPAPGDVFELETSEGELVTWTLQTWSKSTWFVRDDGTDNLGEVGNFLAGEGVLDIDRVVNGHALPEHEDRYVVLEAIGAGAEANVNPDVLRVVPETLDGRRVVVAAAEHCGDGMVCNTASFADDGTLVPPDVLADHAHGFKPTFYEPGETSTYDLEVHCASGCAPPPPERLSATKYPVYYAHGFNSSKLTWEDLLTHHVRGIPGMTGWSQAEDVEAFSPVEIRAETLRRNLTQVLRDTEAREGIPEGERFLKVNIVAHSMGGLDSRYLIGHDKYNARCSEFSCTDADGNDESCCAPPDIDGNPTTWAERVVSLTTLSTPHCGSSFADLGFNVLQNRIVHAGFELVAKKFLGLDEAGAELLERTLFALSQQFCADFMSPSFPPPNPERVYTWQGGEDVLPPPTQTPTVFSFAGVTCVTGSCGDIVDPGLLPSYAYVKNQEGLNDGIVSEESARFGIYMGVLPHDHFDWTRTAQEARLEKWGGRLAGWLFGVRKEPAARFHLHWLDRLREAGY